MPEMPRADEAIEEREGTPLASEFVIPEIVPPKEPFRGIESFRFCDQTIFPERREQSIRLQKMVLIYRATLLSGSSGVGKSSLVNAGFLPEILRENYLPERVQVRPQQNAIFQVERIALGEANQPQYLPSRFVPESHEEGVIALSAEEFTKGISGPHSAGPPLLIFDQFEELITLFDETPDTRQTRAAGAHAQTLVVDTLAGILRDPNTPVKFLFAFREDYYLKLSSKFFDCLPGLREHGMYLEPFPKSRIHQLIREPFIRSAKADHAFERPIDDALAKELAQAIADYTDLPTINLTEVQIICQTLWRDPHGAANFRAAPDKVQHIQKLLERFIDERLDLLSEEVHDPAVGILTRLLTASDTRNIVAGPDLVDRLQKEDHIPAEISQKALAELVTRSRLVNRRGGGDNAFYDVISEFLIPWIRRRRDLRRNEIREKQRIREVLQKEKARRTLWIVFSGACALIALFAVPMWLLTSKQSLLQRKHLVMVRAQRLEDEARRIISQSETAKIDPYPAMLATIDGIASCLKEDAFAPEGALITMRAAAEGVSVGLKPSAPRAQDTKKPTMGKKPEFIPVFSSPDENVHITVEKKNTPVLWDAWTFEPHRLAAVNTSISTVGFSLDSKKVAVVSLGGAVFEWDIPEGVKSVSQKWNTTGGTLAAVLEPASDELKRIQAQRIRTLMKQSEAAWGDYTELTTEWLTQALELVIRRYNNEERMSFPKLLLGKDDVIFTDEANTAREQAKNDIEGAKKQFAKTLSDWGLEKIDAGMTLARMYVSSAQQKSLQPAYREAAAAYDIAQKLNPKLNLSRTAEALRKLQDGNELSPSDPGKMLYYRLAQDLDKPLIDSLVPTLLVESAQLVLESAQLEKESKNIKQWMDKLASANEAARANEPQKARDLYKQAIELAPVTLKTLIPDEEIERLAPKGPMGVDPRPNQASPAPARSP